MQPSYGTPLPHGDSTMPAAIDPSSSRPDGLGFIDEPDLSGPIAGPSRSPSPTPSGSSIEEESEDEEVHDNTHSAVSHRTVDDVSRELLAAFDDVRLRGADIHHEDEDEDWDVEDEDWELADGGERGAGRRLTPDFTKQYNRLRQQHAAVAVGSASRRAVPLPARNVHHTRSAPSEKLLAPGTRSGGVAANPKSDNSRPTKDKADRATTEQVLDARTRLVLSGLVNRGVIGKVEHCVSTGKEVRIVSTGLTLGKRILCSDCTEPPRPTRPLSHRPRGQDLSHIHSPLQVASRLHCRGAPIPGRIFVVAQPSENGSSVGRKRTAKLAPVKPGRHSRAAGC